MEICSKNEQRFVEQASIILQTDPNMLQECLNLLQLPSPNEGLVLVDDNLIYILCKVSLASPSLTCAWHSSAPACFNPLPICEKLST